MKSQTFVTSVHSLHPVPLTLVPSLHGDGHGRLNRVAKGWVKIVPFRRPPLLGVCRGFMFRSCILTKVSGLLVLHFSSMACFAVVSVFMKTKYVAGIFLHFFS